MPGVGRPPQKTEGRPKAPFVKIVRVRPVGRPASALGPIDAQMNWQGRSFSADAFLEGVEKIKQEVKDTGSLNKAYIPILQGISPGELQSAENALKFAKERVTDWLVKYKFKNWHSHAKSGQPVTEAERQNLSSEIATKLCDHRRWLTHGRSIKITDLEEMGLRITDYSQNADLADAIRRYHALLQITFTSTNIYKLFETVASQIYMFAGANVPQQQKALTPQKLQQADIADVEFKCGRCNTVTRLQANLGGRKPLKPGFMPFPPDNSLRCPGCGTENNVASIRRQIEAQAKRPITS